MTTMMEPVAPWLRDLSRLLSVEGPVSGFLPPADVLADEDGVTVYMDVPGLRADDLEIELENDTLTVRGERRMPYGAEAEAGRREVRRIERSFGRFERTLRVPTGLDPSGVEASLTDGVLQLRVPKPESLKPHRVEIKSESETREIKAGSR